MSEPALALATIDEAVDEHELGSVYALFSGGHDSLAALAVAAEHPLFAGAVHINTGIGIEETRDFVRGTCEEQGWPLHEVGPPAGTYEKLVLERGGFPGGLRSHNSMLFYLKQRPLRRWFRGVEGRAAFVTGIRREESSRRMGAGIWVPIRPEGRKVWVSPLLDWTRLDCGRLIEAAGLRRNRVVDLIHRSGECLCGALAREREIHEIAAWFPDAARRINELERECERRGIVASVWAGRGAERLSQGQQALFSKADLAPLCSSCVSEAEA